MTPEEEAENWRLVTAPLGEPWSGRARYAAAMAFYEAGLLEPDVLEVYRICSRLDAQDPLSLIRDRMIGQRWLALIAVRAAH